jgi:hypothetical protein
MAGYCVHPQLFFQFFCAVDPQSLRTADADSRSRLFSLLDLPPIIQEVFCAAKIRIPIKRDFIFASEQRFLYGWFQIVPFCRRALLQ